MNPVVKLLSFVESLNPTSYKKGLAPPPLPLCFGSSLVQWRQSPVTTATTTATTTLLLRIGTHWGIRLEHLTVPSYYVCGSMMEKKIDEENEEEENDDVVLLPANKFVGKFNKGGSQIRISAWGAAECKIEAVTLAKYSAPVVSFLDYDASDSSCINSSSSEADDDKEEEDIAATTVCNHINNNDSSSHSFATTTAITALKKQKRRRAEKGFNTNNNNYRQKNHHIDADSSNSSITSFSFLQNHRKRVLKKKKITITPPEKGKNVGRDNNHDVGGTVDQFFQIQMSDLEIDVQYIWIILFSGKKQCSSISVHPSSYFHIENTCGSCMSPYELNLECFEFLKGRGATGDLIATLAGTFAPCLSKMHVDFRGVRSMHALIQDWKVVSGLDIVDTQVTIYMLVLKGHIGLPLFLDENSISPPLSSTSSSSYSSSPASSSTTITSSFSSFLFDLTKKTQQQHAPSSCFIANRLRDWHMTTIHHTDVCHTVELKDIQWSMFIPSPHALLLLAKSSFHVSRRGGAMLRIIFPRGTSWSLEAEQAILNDSNRFMDAIRRLLRGQSAF